MRLARIAFIALMLWPLGLAAKSPRLQCRADIRHALNAGHFSGVMFCSEENSYASLVLVGRTAGGRFSIYDYRYRFLPHPGGVYHGGQRLLVFRGKKYLGHYMLSGRPLATVTVKGTRVLLSGLEPPGKVQLDFPRTPPREVLVNGELDTFAP